MNMNEPVCVCVCVCLRGFFFSMLSADIAITFAPNVELACFPQLLHA